jgi:hypothetical protein
LTPRESAEIEHHLADCSRCVHRARRAYFAIGGLVPASTVSVETVPSRERAEKRKWFPQIAIAAACAATLLVAVALYYGQRSRALPGANPPIKPLISDAVVAAGYSASGKLVLTSREIPAAWRASVLEMIEAKALKQPPALQLAIELARSGRRGGEKQSLKLLSPITTAIGTTRPTFSWSAVPNAPVYTLFIEDETQHELPPQMAGKGTEFQLPPGADLPTGHTYTWMVETIIAGRKIDSDRESFEVPQADILSTVSQFEKEFAGSPMLLAALYETYGYYNDASAQLSLLAKLNPNSVLPQEMLAELAKRRETR